MIVPLSAVVRPAVEEGRLAAAAAAAEDDLLAGGDFKPIDIEDRQRFAARLDVGFADVFENEHGRQNAGRAVVARSCGEAAMIAARRRGP
jgi:hypothetical protein